MLDWFAERWNDFITWGLSLLLSVWDMFNDLICYVLEQLFNVVTVLISGISGAFTTFSITTYLEVLPSQMLNLMALIGVNEVSVIIVSAVIVRFLLQLIPFVRLGS